GFWPTEDSANPDTETLIALRPAMATVPTAMLLVISSPYARRGELWKRFRDSYGRDDDNILVWKADSLTMNPTLDLAIVTQAYADDPSVAGAEYGAEFRTDVETIFTRESLDTVIVHGRRELWAQAGAEYKAF